MSQTDRACLDMKTKEDCLKAQSTTEGMECCFLEKYWDGDDDSECMATINTDEAMNILIGDSGGIEIKNVFCNPKESESGESIDIEEENEINDTKTENGTFYLKVNLVLIEFFSLF